MPLHYYRELSVDHRLEIEGRVLKAVPKAVSEQIVERVIVFTLSGSCIVDLKIEKGAAAIRLSNGTLTNFFCQLIL